MCGRFTCTATPEQIMDAISELDIDPGYQPSYNLAPTQPIPTVLNLAPNKLLLSRWGLLPEWARDARLSHKLINARAETLAVKNSFKTSYRRYRCLILSDGFYEWSGGQKNKKPWHIRRRDRKLMAFAGLWNDWLSPDGSEVLTSSIVTTRANRVIRPVHHRMPVILDRTDWAAWLNPGEVKPGQLDPLLRPAPDADLEMVPVSPWMNQISHNGPDCLSPPPTPPQMELEL